MFVSKGHPVVSYSRNVVISEISLKDLQIKVKGK